MLENRSTVSVTAVLEGLRDQGFALFVGDDGVVHGRKLQPGMRISMEARRLIDQLQSVNDEAAKLLRSEQRHEYDRISVDEALALGKEIQAGHLALAGKVIYHSADQTCSLVVKERTDDDDQ